MVVLNPFHLAHVFFKHAHKVVVRNHKSTRLARTLVLGSCRNVNSATANSVFKRVLLAVAPHASELNGKKLITAIDFLRMFCTDFLVFH